MDLKERKQINIIKYIILYMFLYSLHLTVTLMGDDFFFAEVSDKYSLVNYLITRYENWSGRIFPEIILYTMLDDLVWLWRMINPLMLIILSFGMVRILKKEVTFFNILIAVLTLGYFNQGILSGGFFWITGSINYLWPITLGLLSMIPFADKVLRDEITDKKIFSVYFILGLLASISQEQVSLCISSFAVLTIITLFYRRRKIEKRYLFMTGMLIIGTLILVLAPGNSARWMVEVDTWYPDFDELSLKAKTFYGIIWIYQKTFFDMKGIVFLLSIILILSCIKNKFITNGFYFKSFIILVIVNVSLNFFDIGITSLYDFESLKSWVNTGPWSYIGFIKVIIPYIFWSVYGFLLFYIFIKNSDQKIFTLITIFASFCTLIIMFFSPTIYASGNRVLSVFAIIISLNMLNIIYKNKLIVNKFLIFLYSCVPMINLFKMIFIWINDGFRFL